MHTFSIADAKAQLSRLIELVEAGEEVTITRCGQPVVKLVRTLSSPQNLPSLAEFRDRLPQQDEPAGEFIRHLRDSERY